jgi:hypothetical protein
MVLGDSPLGNLQTKRFEDADSWNNSMRIATYNVNGVNARLANLLEWLKEARRTSSVFRS